MSKVITFSRQFPAYHPKAGQPTFFVEKILNAFDTSYMDFKTLEIWRELNKDNTYDPENLWANLWDLNVGIQTTKTKHHTIRSGHRWKVGDKFSPRVWSGKPYNSKQIIIAPDIEIVRTWNFNIDTDGIIVFNGVPIECGKNLELIAKNDGLELQDFYYWFKYPKPFSGQIICWLIVR